MWKKLNEIGIEAFYIIENNMVEADHKFTGLKKLTEAASLTATKSLQQQIKELNVKCMQQGEEFAFS